MSVQVLNAPPCPTCGGYYPDAPCSTGCLAATEPCPKCGGLCLTDEDCATTVGRSAIDDVEEFAPLYVKTPLWITYKAHVAQRRRNW